MTLISWSQLCRWSSCLHMSQFYVAASWGCRDLFFFLFLFFRLQPQFYVAAHFLLPNYFPGRDIKVVLRPHFLLLSSSSGHDLNEWSRHHFRSLICNRSQVPFFGECFYLATGCDLFSKSIFGCTLNLPVFMSRHRGDVTT